ncbi:aldehyde dehydrogenase family protein, partial [Enterobacter mori]
MAQCGGQCDFFIRERGEGGRVVWGGYSPAYPNVDKGFFYQPNIFAGLRNSPRPCQVDKFGRVVVAMGFRDEPPIIRDANDSV